ncbi:hypothetical protein N0V91_005792 [Didymella pomorum]|uniref:Uncharacterized protein n=1 Tax=Didymella pomorum TaxID=749634 RepID=A0A9W8ZDN3_9PLEO|nr:hypothetical protein N0V91_005792 [Didymella pomorum]
MPPSDSKAGPEFQYPPAQADRSLTSLDLDTLMMKSTTRRSQEEPGSSLDDSTYELLTDSLIETSDDEAHTASIASTSDDHTQDDGSIFGDDDDDDDFETNDRALDASIQSMHAAAADDDLETLLEAGAEDSMLTMVPEHMNGSSRSRMIQLDEEPTEDSEVSLGRATVRGFPTQTEEVPKVLETAYGQPQVQLGVKAALSSRYITTPESYKIVYLGLPEQWVQDNITQHIHAALTASPSKTRSVMVRGQMEPLGTVIDTYRATKLELINDDLVRPLMNVHIDGGRRITIGQGKKPKFDLVILCHTQKRDYATDAPAYDLLRTALRQHSIAILELSEIKPYGAGSHTYDGRGMVATIEGRSDDGSDFQLLEVLPLDVYTFCDLEPAQVNRHLALISPHLLPPAIESAPKSHFSAVTDTVRAIVKQLRTGAPASTKVLLLSIALTMMLSAFALGPMYMPRSQQKFTDTASEPPMLSVSPTSVASLTSSAFVSSSTASVPLPSSSSLSVPKGLSIVAPQAEQPKAKPKQNLKKTDETPKAYDIQTAGEKQFILTPSGDLANSRKKPQLHIQVFRNTTTVPVRYVRTITGEYFVDLVGEYPFGTFNISIASYSKPLLRQSFEVTLGHNKTWVDQMLGVAANKIVHAQSVLLDVSSVAVEQLQARLDDVIGSKLGPLVEEGRHLEEMIYDSAKERLESGTEFVKHVPETTWAGLRKATAPVRLSQTMWKARVNALRIRCTAESALGKFWKRSAEQSSRACSELQSVAKKGEA